MPDGTVAPIDHKRTIEDIIRKLRCCTIWFLNGFAITSSIRSSNATGHVGWGKRHCIKLCGDHSPSTLSYELPHPMLMWTPNSSKESSKLRPSCAWKECIHPQVVSPRDTEQFQDGSRWDGKIGWVHHICKVLPGCITAHSKTPTDLCITGLHWRLEKIREIALDYSKYIRIISNYVQLWI